MSRHPSKRIKPSRQPRTEWQRARLDALAAKGYTKVDVHRELQRRGASYSTSTVYSVIDGRFRSPIIQAAFCALAGIENDVAFPSTEPAYESGKPPRTAPRRHYTKRAR